MQLDALDHLAAKAFEGYIVRKDLVRHFKGQYPVPTYVAEFLLGRYCASMDETEIQEGLAIVQRQLASRTVRAGEDELFKARAKEQGRVKLIDMVKARLDAKNDVLWPNSPACGSTMSASMMTWSTPTTACSPVGFTPRWI